MLLLFYSSMPFCSNCGKEIKEGIKFCSDCGAKAGAEEKKEIVVEFKKPKTAMKIVAIILSLFLPGLGHLILGKPHTDKGIKLLIGAVISAVLFIILIGFISYLVIWVYAIIDLAKVETIY